MRRRSFLAAAAGLPIAGHAARAAPPARRGANGLSAFPPDGPPVVDWSRWLPKPVSIAAVDVVALGPAEQFVRVTSTDGVAGVVVANSRMEEVVSLLDTIVVPRLVGRDAREIEALVADIARRDYKFAGLALWTAIGHVELAVWDMLGKAAGIPCAQAMGGIVRRRVPIYLSSLNRNTTPEQEVAWLGEAVARTGATGIKIKVGGRMSRNRDAAPGRQEALVTLARRTFGDRMTIYADANGSFDAPTALRLCEHLEANGVAILEEPCPFDEFEMTRQVSAAVGERGWKVRIAGGEQDGSMAMWRWYLDNRALHVLQPDFMYNGGMARTLAVARMAAEAGVGVAPHYPRNGVETVEMLHFAAHIPNLHGLQEYRGRPRPLNFGHSPRIEPRDGMLDLPDGPGFGATYDPDIFARARRLNAPVKGPS